MAYQSQFERLELKYLVDESTALAICRAIAPFCEPDSYNGRCGRGYYIGSLYLDSSDLAFFRAKERSDNDRLKLRARVYDDTGPVSLEIKRKRGDIVSKERASVPRAGWADAALGFAKTPPQDARQARSLERFAQLVAQFGAEPTMMVEYEREAYAASTGEYARVTFDRKVRAYATDQWSLWEPNADRRVLDTGTSSLFGSAVVLELKAELFMPPWMVEVIRHFELSRVGYSKYNTGMRTHLQSVWVTDPLLRELSDV